MKQERPKSAKIELINLGKRNRMNKKAKKIIGAIIISLLILTIFYFIGSIVAHQSKCGVWITEGNGSSMVGCSWWGENYLRFIGAGFFISLLGVVGMIILLGFFYGCYELSSFLYEKIFIKDKRRDK